MTDERLRQWHRLFGIALTQLFQGAPWRVELEYELALQRQLLDVVIIEAPESGSPPPLPPDLPDGLEALRAHNLLTYKSQHEALDAWALDELVGHYVNYRKLTLDAKGARLPADAFGLYAVATRDPKALAAQHRLEPAGAPGLYDLAWGSQVVRLIVLNTIEQTPRNAPWALFASELGRLREAVRQYRERARRNPDNGALALLERLYLNYLSEAPEMAYTLEDFLQETQTLMLEHMSAEERLKGLDPEERLKGLDPEERLKGLDPEERLKGLDPEERLKGLDPEERLKGLDPEERLKGLDPEERLKGLDPAFIEAWLNKQRREH